MGEQSDDEDDRRVARMLEMGIAVVNAIGAFQPLDDADVLAALAAALMGFAESGEDRDGFLAAFDRVVAYLRRTGGMLPRIERAMEPE